MLKEHAKRIFENRQLWKYFVIAAFALPALLSCQLASLGAPPAPTPLPFPDIIHKQAECSFGVPSDQSMIDYAAIKRGECGYVPIPTPARYFIPKYYV